MMNRTLDVLHEDRAVSMSCAIISNCITYIVCLIYILLASAEHYNVWFISFSLKMTVKVRFLCLYKRILYIEDISEYRCTRVHGFILLSSFEIKINVFRHECLFLSVI